MLRAGAFMAALLVLGPVQVAGFPILCRLLAPWEPWPGRIEEYQQISVTDTRNCLHKTALKKESRSYKNIKINLEATRKNAERNRQQKNVLKDVILYQKNLNLISGDSIIIQVLGRHLGAGELILRGKTQLIKISNNILKNEKLDVYKERMNKKKPNTKMEQLKLIYFEHTGSWKYMGTRLPLVITEETHLTKYQEDWKSILASRLLKQQQSRGRGHIAIQMLPKEKCKNNTDRVLPVASAKERENFKENTNAYTKDQYVMFLAVKQILNDKRKGPYREFKKYGPLFVNCQQKSVCFVKEKMKVEKWKTNKKTIENQKFPFIHAFTHRRGSYNIWKIFLAYETIMSHIKKIQDSIIKEKTSRYKNQIKNQSMLFKVFIRESKTRETGTSISSKLYYIQSSDINNNFLFITTARKIRSEARTSEINQIKSFVYMIEMLKHLMQSSQNKYFSVAHMRFRNSALKTFAERKHLSRKSFLNMLCLHKHIFQVPSVVERTKRSTKGENIQIPAASFNRVISALETCAVIFVIILLAFVLAACYLFYNRRQFKQFLNLIRQGGEFPQRSEPTYSNHSPPISVPQNAHSETSQQSSKKRTTAREQERRHTAESPSRIKRATESYPKESSDTNMKEVNARSDTDFNSKRLHRGFTVRSKAYVLPSESSESMESLCDDDVWETSSAELSSSTEIMENRFSNQPRSNTKRKENAPISVACHSYKNQDYNPSSDELLKLKKPKVSKSKSENNIYTSSSTELRAVRSFTIFDGRYNP